MDIKSLANRPRLRNPEGKDVYLKDICPRRKNCRPSEQPSPALPSSKIMPMSFKATRSGKAVGEPRPKTDL